MSGGSYNYFYAKDADELRKRIDFGVGKRCRIYMADLWTDLEDAAPIGDADPLPRAICRAIVKHAEKAGE